MLAGMIEARPAPSFMRDRTPRRARIGALIATLPTRAALAILVATLGSCTTTARVSDVYTALDGNGDRKRSVFSTDTKEIHCIVESGIGRKGTTLETLVRQLQGYDFVNDKVFDTNRVTANVETALTPADSIQKTDLILNPKGPDGSDAAGAPFARGRFQCEAYLDGKVEQIAIFNVDFPDCPASSIRPGTTCLGFYRPRMSCRKYGLTATDPAQCRCSPTAGWECDP